MHSRGCRLTGADRKSSPLRYTILNPSPLLPVGTGLAGAALPLGSGAGFGLGLGILKRADVGMRRTRKHTGGGGQQQLAWHMPQNLSSVPEFPSCGHHNSSHSHETTEATWLSWHTFSLLNLQSVRLLQTGWECYKSAPVRSWSLVSLRSDNVKPPQGKCVDGAVHFISAGQRTPSSTACAVKP